MNIFERNPRLTLRSQGTYWHLDSLKSPIQTSKNVFTRFELSSTTQNKKTNESLLQSFEKNLRAFISIARIYDMTPILMTQANRLDNDDFYHLFNQQIREVGKKEKVKVIDLAKEIPPKEEYLYDHYHYTQAGSRLASQIISTEIKTLIQ